VEVGSAAAPRACAHWLLFGLLALQLTHSLLFQNQVSWLVTLQQAPTRDCQQQLQQIYGGSSAVVSSSESRHPWYVPGGGASAQVCLRAGWSACSPSAQEENSQQLSLAPGSDHCRPLQRMPCALNFAPDSRQALVASSLRPATAPSRR
jgi:hypothetical protein